MKQTPPPLVDTHCHLADEVFAGRLPAVIRAGKDAGVTRFVAPGTGPDDWHQLQELQKRYPEVAPAYGLHPMHSQLCSPELLALLQSVAPSAVAIGEIGLDYTLAVPRDVQQQAFRQQLRLAAAYDLPILVHCRKAFQDLLRILYEERRGVVRGVMHAYSGSVETAIKCMEMGLYISIAGTVTFANAIRPVAVTREIPLNHLVLETDAPDLSPEPYRKQRNQPAFLAATATKVAEIKGISLDELAAATTSNALHLFNLH